MKGNYDMRGNTQSEEVKLNRPEGAIFGKTEGGVNRPEARGGPPTVRADGRTRIYTDLQPIYVISRCFSVIVKRLTTAAEPTTRAVTTPAGRHTAHHEPDDPEKTHLTLCYYVYATFRSFAFATATLRSFGLFERCL